VVEETWCRIEDAAPAAQYVGPIHETGGLMRYLALHFFKEDQSPPEGWTGQRFNCSRGYFTGCTRRVARARAREAQQLKRERWKASRGLTDAHDVELQAREQLELAHRTVWTLTNDRGARVGRVAYDPARLVLGRKHTWRDTGPVATLRQWRESTLKRTESQSAQERLPGLLRATTALGASDAQPVR